jgi:hypothetical protein
MLKKLAVISKVIKKRAVRAPVLIVFEAVCEISCLSLCKIHRRRHKRRGGINYILNSAEWSWCRSVFHVLGVSAAKYASVEAGLRAISAGTFR